MRFVILILWIVLRVYIEFTFQNKNWITYKLRNFDCHIIIIIISGQSRDENCLLADDYKTKIVNNVDVACGFGLRALFYAITLLLAHDCK